MPIEGEYDPSLQTVGPMSGERDILKKKKNAIDKTIEYFIRKLSNLFTKAQSF